jgi:hypothetical protein
MFAAATVFKISLLILKGFPLIVILMTSFELENKYKNEAKPQPKHQIMSGDGTPHPARFSFGRSSGCRLDRSLSRLLSVWTWCQKKMLPLLAIEFRFRSP